MTSKFEDVGSRRLAGPAAAAVFVRLFKYEYEYMLRRRVSFVLRSPLFAKYELSYELLGWTYSSGILEGGKRVLRHSYEYSYE
eukprot:scaffold57778_cov17-Prasinocladus_malaysianus.AAC.1